MNKSACVFLVILFTLFVCVSEESAQPLISFQAINEQMNGDGGSIDLQLVFSVLMEGDIEGLKDELLKKGQALFYERLTRVGAFIAHAAWLSLILSIVSRFVPVSSGSGAMLVINLIVCISLLERSQVFFDDVKKALHALSGVIDQVTPMMVSLLALTGGTHLSAFITPAGAFASGAGAVYLQKGALTLIYAYLCAVLMKSVSGAPLSRLTTCLKSLVTWLIGTVTGAFLLFVSAGSVLSGAYDGAFQKGFRYAADHLIPIVGSDIAGKMDAISSSVQLVKSASGITGMIALAAVCIRPALDVFLVMWALRILAAVLEPVACPETVSALDGFSSVFSLLFSLICASLSMGVVLLGAVIGVGMRAFG